MVETGALYCLVLARKAVDSLQFCLWAFICVEDSLQPSHWLSLYLHCVEKEVRAALLIKAKMLTKKLLSCGLKRWMNLDHQCAAYSSQTPSPQ